MFEKILVPLDGSLLAERALPQAAAVAGAFASQVTLLRVIEGGAGPGLGPADPLAWQMRRMEAEAYLEAVRCRLAESGVEARGVVMEGDAAGRIVEQAESECDLVALSTHGRSGLAPWNAGSVAQKVLAQAKSSVLLVRAFEEAQREPARPIERIVAPLDGSRRAEAVLPLAVRLVERGRPQPLLVLLHVVTRPVGLSVGTSDSVGGALAEELVRRNAAEATAYLRGVQTRIGVECEVRVVVGDKLADGIEALAAEGRHDLVLASAHGEGCDEARRFGGAIGEVVLFGTGPLFLYQDMRPGQLRPTLLEAAVQGAVGERSERQGWLERPRRMEWHTV